MIRASSSPSNTSLGSHYSGPVLERFLPSTWRYLEWSSNMLKPVLGASTSGRLMKILHWGTIEESLRNSLKLSKLLGYLNNQNAHLSSIGSLFLLQFLIAHFKKSFGFPVLGGPERRASSAVVWS